MFRDYCTKPVDYIYRHYLHPGVMVGSSLLPPLTGHQWATKNYKAKYYQAVVPPASGSLFQPSSTQNPYIDGAFHDYRLIPLSQRLVARGWCGQTLQ